MRVGIVGIQHESNTFLPVPTTIEHFRNGAILTARRFVAITGTRIMS